MSNMTTKIETTSEYRKFSDLKLGDVLWTSFGYEANVTAITRQGPDYAITAIVYVRQGEDLEVPEEATSVGAHNSTTLVKTGFEIVEVKLHTS